MDSNKFLGPSQPSGTSTLPHCAFPFPPSTLFSTTKVTRVTGDIYQKCGRVRIPPFTANFTPSAVTKKSIPARNAPSITIGLADLECNRASHVFSDGRCGSCRETSPGDTPRPFRSFPISSDSFGILGVHVRRQSGIRTGVLGLERK